MDSSTVLRLPSKLSKLKKLNKPASWYKTSDKQQQGKEAKQDSPSSWPLYYEIDFIDEPPKKGNKGPKPLDKLQPTPPPPYSGSLFTQISLELCDDRTSPVLRGRSKSSSFAERHSIDSVGSYLGGSNRTSQSSVGTQSVILDGYVAKQDMSGNYQQQQTIQGASKETQHVDITEKQGLPSSDASSQQRKEGKQNKSISKMSTSDDDDEYVQMSSVRLALASTSSTSDQIKQAISSPLLVEDNMYVTMTRKDLKQSYYSAGEQVQYYNLRDFAKNSSLPNLSSANKETEGKKNNYEIYEEIDLSRPVPPPRRKKLLKLQSLAAESNPSSSPRHHTVSSTTPSSNLLTRNVAGLRETRAISLSPKQRRERPQGMVFSEVDELNLEKTFSQ